MSLDPELVHGALAAVVGAITAVTAAFFLRQRFAPSSLPHALERIAQHRAEMRFSDALAVAKELVRTHPNNLRARVMLVEQLVSVGETKRARLEIDRLAQDRPGRHVDELRTLLASSLQER